MNNTLEQRVEAMEKKIAALEEQIPEQQMKIDEMFTATICSMIAFAENFQIEVPKLEQLKAKYPNITKV